MLAKLKVECGYQFTQKLEGMFHDMKLSSDTMEVYQEHLAKTDVGLRISPRVCSTFKLIGTVATTDRYLSYRDDIHFLANVSSRSHMQSPRRIDAVLRTLQRILSLETYRQTSDLATLPG